MLNKKVLTVLMSIAIPFALGACHSADVGEPPVTVDVPTTTTAYDILLDQPELTLAPSATWVEMTTRVDRGDHDLVDTTRLPVDRGNLFLSADAYGDVQIDGLAIAFDDVVAGQGTVTADGFRLTDIVARLDSPVACDAVKWRRDGNLCSTTATLQLTLDWSLKIGNEIYPLGAQQLGNMDLYIEIYLQRDQLHAELEGVATGVFWNWADIVEFSDLSLYTMARTGPIVD